MTNIFVSHSRKDTTIRDWFSNIFASSSVKSIRKEFEDFTNLPPWKSIANDIANPETQAVFVLLGPNVMGSQYTLNWVAYEVGIAAGLNKDVWIFEEYFKPVNFPIPFANHYMRYTLKDLNHFNYVRSMVDGYLAWFPVQRQANVSKGTRVVECGYPDCRAIFYYHNREDDLICPTCRRVLNVTPQQQPEGQP